jgi:hypothetical protein
MRGVIILILVVVVGLAFVQWVNAFKARSDLAARVERQLDLVDSNAIDSVKQTLVQQARQIGIALSPDNIQITYEDTEQRTLAQKIVGKKIGAQFVNKRATISVHYIARILGLPVSEDVSNSHVRQVEAPRMPVPREERQLLDPTGASAGVDIGQ